MSALRCCLSIDTGGRMSDAPQPMTAGALRTTRGYSDDWCACGQLIARSDDRRVIRRVKMNRYAAARRGAVHSNDSRESAVAADERGPVQPVVSPAFNRTAAQLQAIAARAASAHCVVDGWRQQEQRNTAAASHSGRTSAAGRSTARRCNSCPSASHSSLSHTSPPLHLHSRCGGDSNRFEIARLSVTCRPFIFFHFSSAAFSLHCSATTRSVGVVWQEQTREGCDTLGRCCCCDG